MTGAEAVDRKEGTAGLSSPRAGAGRTASHIKNFHPTVKPVALMKKLVASVDKGETIVDPFMGSGPTGIACLGSHDFIGIEIDAGYFEIAEARIRHWDRANNGWIQNKIQGEEGKDTEESSSSSSSLSLSELFGF
jgi:site-specific DNA-methyltransferase (adenine-specific)